MGIDITVEDNSVLAIAAVNAAVVRGLEKVGLLAEGYAKQLCPVDTGRLRNSITHALDGEAPAITTYHASYGSNTHTVKNRRTGQMETRRYSASSKNAGAVAYGSYSGTLPKEPEGQRAVIIGTNVEYAPKIEMGGSKQAPAGFMKPAIVSHIDQYRRAIASELSDVSS